MGLIGIDACLVIAKKYNTERSLCQGLNIGLIEFRLSSVICFTLRILFFIHRVLWREEN